MKRTVFRALPLFAAATLATPVAAQILSGGRGPDSSSTIVITPGSDSTPEFVRRSTLSIGFSQLRPIGDLSRNIGFGYGGTANYLYRLDRAGIAGLRVGLAYAAYGHESKRVPLSETIGGRILTDVNTYNTVGALSLGPQLMFPTGWLRPYVNAGVSVLWFATTSSVSGIEDIDQVEHDFATRNYDDGTPSWTMGGGVDIPLSHRNVGILIDLGVDYFFGGEASYLRPGSIVDLPGARIAINPFRSETRFVNVTLGVKLTP